MKIGDKDFALSHGSHKPSDGDGCVMEVVGVKWLMRHGWSLADAWNQLTDAPPCTDPMVYKAAQSVNDSLTDEGLLRLELRVDRLMSCHTPLDAMSTRRVRVRVACWAARRVLHLVDESRRDVALRAIETAEAWLRGEADQEECRAAAAASATYATTYAAADAAYATADATATTYDATYATTYAAASATYATTYAAADAAAASASLEERDDALLDFLDDMLDAWGKACAIEGTLGDEPPMPTQANGS